MGRGREELSRLIEGVVPVLRHDDVIEDADAQDFARLDETVGHAAIFAARCRVAAGVVVDEDECSRGLLDGLAKDLPRMHETRRQGALRYEHLAGQAMAAIEEQRVEALVRATPEPLEEVVVHVCRTLDPRSDVEAPCRNAPADLASRNQRRALRGPHSRERTQRRLVGTRDPGEPAEPIEQTASNLQDGAPRPTRPEEKRDELGVRERLHADSSEAFTQPVESKARGLARRR